MILNLQFQKKKLTEARIVSMIMYHKRALLLGEAGKSLNFKTELSNLVVMKTTWNFALPSDKIANGTWTLEKEYVKLFVERGIDTIKGPLDMSPFCKRQKAMDAVSWCLFWERRHEFDHFLKFQADLIRHIISWLTQDEEDAFKRKCDAVDVGMTDKGKKSTHFMSVSRFQDFSGIQRRRACSMYLAR